MLNVPTMIRVRISLSIGSQGTCYVVNWKANSHLQNSGTHTPLGMGNLLTPVKLSEVYISY